MKPTNTKIESRALMLGLSAIFFLAISSRALAITNGEPDGEAHPSVGGLLSPTQYSDGTWIYCTGALISPTVFLTAAHCNTGSEDVRVSFSSNYTDGEKTYSGKFKAHPQFGHHQNNTYDIAVVVFNQPIEGIRPAKLPTLGLLSGLDKNQKFVSVGFGAYEVTNEPGGHKFLYNDSRNFSRGTLSAINKAWLRISQNSATDDGGTCYGDSGGPNFLADGDIIAGITVTGDAVCRARNVVYRMDTQEVRDFLSKYVSLP